MKYPLVRNKFLRIYLYLEEFLCRILTFFPRQKIFSGNLEQDNVHRILLRNPAAFGDVLYSLRVATSLKNANPHLEVGMMVGSWAAALLQSCPAIDHLHFENHWAIAQSGGSLPCRFWKWLKCWWSLRQDVMSIGYDVAVDLYYYFPSAGTFFWSADIPLRFGYDVGGDAKLLTASKRWQFEEKHNVEYQADLLRWMGYSLTDLVDARSTFCFQISDEMLLNRYHIAHVHYAVFHIGTSDSLREWDVANWVQLARFIEKRGVQICFTGKGDHEQELIDWIMERLENKHCSLCNKLSISELMQVIHRAAFFIGVESFAGHIAALYHVPQVSIMHGATNQAHWRPYGNPRCHIIRTVLPCSPCYFPKLCDKVNACMNISPESVIAEVEKFLPLR